MSESRVKVAAVQAAPVFLDLEASLQKALALIEKAAAEGAQLVVFPEAFLPAWPAWVDEVLPGEDAAWHIRLLEQSVVVPGPVTPAGTVLAGPLVHEEGILYAGLDLAAARARRRLFDPVGHYNRPDVFRLVVDDRPKPPLVSLARGEAGPFPTAGVG